MKNKRHRESISIQDGVGEPSKISLKSKKKDQSKSQYALKSTHNKNQDSFKQNRANQKKENKLINQSGSLYHSKKEKSAESLIKPELINDSLQE